MTIGQSTHSGLEEPSIRFSLGSSHFQYNYGAVEGEPQVRIGVIRRSNPVLFRALAANLDRMENFRRRIPSLIDSILAQNQNTARRANEDRSVPNVDPPATEQGRVPVIDRSTALVVHDSDHSLADEVDENTSTEEEDGDDDEDEKDDNDDEDEDDHDDDGEYDADDEEDDDEAEVVDEDSSSSSSVDDDDEDIDDLDDKENGNVGVDGDDTERKEKEDDVANVAAGGPEHIAEALTAGAPQAETPPTSPTEEPVITRSRLASLCRNGALHPWRGDCGRSRVDPGLLRVAGFAVDPTTYSPLQNPYALDADYWAPNAPIYQDLRFRGFMFNM